MICPICKRVVIAGDEETALGCGEQRIGLGNFLHHDDRSAACTTHVMNETCWCEPEIERLPHGRKLIIHKSTQ